MKTWLAAGALALTVSISGSAFADVPPPDPPAEDAPKAKVPDMPAIPADLEKRVAALAKVVRNYDARCKESGERNPWPDASPKCPRWLRTLRAGGEPAVHAIGRYRGGPVPDDLPAFEETLGYESPFNGGTGDALLEVLADSRSKTAITYILHNIQTTADDDVWQYYRAEGLTAISTITGYPFYTWPAWYDESADTDERLGRAVADASAWWEANSAGDPAAWKAAGLLKYRDLLAADSLHDRYRAIHRLLSIPAERAAAVTALHDALAMDDVSGEARNAFFTLARNQKVPKQALADVPPAPKYDEDSGEWIQPELKPTAQKKVAAVQQAKAIAGVADAPALVKRCQRAFYALQLEEAQSLCKKAAELDPGNGEAVLGYGWASLELGHTSIARDQASKALELPSDKFKMEAHQLFGAALTVEGEIGAAMAAFEAVKELGKVPADVKARLGLLNGDAPTGAWVRYVAPRWFCWKKQGDTAAASYLKRRGFVDPKVFDAALATVPAEDLATLQERGEKRCPWSEQAKGPN